DLSIDKAASGYTLTATAPGLTPATSAPFVVARVGGISGQLTTSTMWTLADSPVLVTGNILVNSGVTLAIEAGVEVRFDSGTALQVNGSLVARGTPSGPIVFTSSSPSPSPGDWLYIFFTDSSSDASYDASGDYTAGSILEHCQIRYAGGSGTTAALKIDVSSPLVRFCTIQDSAANGISVSQGAPRIQTNNLLHNASRGLYVNNYPGGGDVLVDQNTISFNSQGGLYAYFYSNSGVFTDNTFQGNGGPAIQASAGGLTITGNFINSNGGGINIDGGGCTTAQISNNTIINNSASSGGGIYSNPGWCGSTHTITDNILANNQASSGGALYVASGGTNKVYVRNNTMWGNTSPNAVVYFTGAGSDEFLANTVFDNSATSSPRITMYITGLPTIHSNNFSNPTNTFEVYNANTSGGPNLNAKDNWWGTVNQEEIRTRIYDFFDNATLGVVEYSPFLNTPDTSAPVSPPRGLSATPGPTSISLTWTANPETDVAGYKVYYDTDGPEPPYQGTGASQGTSPITVGNVTSF
ncbi:MAG: right-handed parallel beta-helix repeat-containing protein, partial [Chloroflexota bacterium]